METVKDRLQEFLRSHNMSNAEFSRRMGLSVAYVSAMRRSLPEEKVMKMMEIFPDLNRDWLLYGEGDMTQKPRERKKDDSAQFLIPLLPVEAYAGNLQAYSRGVGANECSQIACPVKGAEFAIPISGDSMEPQIHNGSVAACCRINERAFIPWGNVLIIDTENGVYIKQVYESERGMDFIEARSFNPKYPKFDIPTSAIYGIYRITAIMQNYSTL